MQRSLALDGRQGLLAYPVQATDTPGVLGAQAITSAAWQHPGDGVTDPHGIVHQELALQAQVAAFFGTGLANDVATLSAP